MKKPDISSEDVSSTKVRKYRSKIVHSPAAGNELEEEGDETEIAAQVTVPKNGGWGWVVVASSFMNFFILDGTFSSFGAVMADISREMNKPMSVIALANSLQISMYYMMSPVASAVVNRFGFRACAMTGSMIVSFAFFCTYFAESFSQMIFFYGLTSGFGASLINLASGVVVGFYFEKNRSLALGIASVGASVGIMLLFPLNKTLAGIADWRSVTLLQSGLFGLIFFTSMSYRPLLTLTMVETSETEEHPTRTVTILPNLASKSVVGEKVLRASPTERFFCAVSNSKFPTAATVVTDTTTIGQNHADGVPSTSTANKSRLMITAISTGAVSHKQLKNFQPKLQSQINKSIMDMTLIKIEKEEMKKRKGCCSWCVFEKHAAEARPMYRDDAFYEGKVEKLPAYQKSVKHLNPEERTGLEYQMEVSRAISVDDLKQKRGICTTAIRRVLVSMLDPTLLKTRSFLFFCVGNMLYSMGSSVPLVFVSDKNEIAGVDKNICNFFISAMGLMNACGRVIFGICGDKRNPFLLFGAANIIAGLSSALSSVSSNVIYQFTYCGAYGFFSSVVVLRNMCLVTLFGLEKLTNSVGILLIFVGVGSLFGTPIAGAMKDSFGYTVAFCVSGMFVMTSGVFQFMAMKLMNK